MGTYRRVSDLDEFVAPWNKRVLVQEVEYEGGLRLLRLRIREGRRFTDLDLAPDDAARLGGALVSWAEDHAEPDSGG